MKKFNFGSSGQWTERGKVTRDFAEKLIDAIMPDSLSAAALGRSSCAN
jgi:hypothetical protein